MFYMLLCGTKSTRRLLWPQVNKPDGEWDLAPDEIDKLVDKNSAGFYMWLIVTMNQRGQCAARQLFYITSVMMFRGFSRRGVDLFSKFGVTLPIRTQDKFKEQELAMELGLTK